MNRTRFGLIAGLMAMLLLFSGCSQNDSVDSVSGATQKGESQSSVDSTDTTSSASLYFYEQGSLTGEEADDCDPECGGQLFGGNCQCGWFPQSGKLCPLSCR